MKVLLIATATNQTWPPLNLLYLAGKLDANGVDCTIIDENIVGKNMVHHEIHKGYDIVGLSVLSASRWDAFNMAQDVRRISPESKIVMGGVHASLVPDQCKQYADYVVYGDGESQLLDICQGKEPGRKPSGDVLDLTPAWHLIDLYRYPGKGITKYNFSKFNGVNLRKEPRISVMGSRSCESKCNFCSSWHLQGKYRMRDPVKLADELQLLYEQYKIRSFYFVDDSFYLDKSQCLKFCQEIIDRRMRIAFLVQTKADVIDEEYAFALREAGCYRVLLGVESGDEAIVANMCSRDKNVTMETVGNAIKYLKNVGICAEALFIVGNIGETDESVEKTRCFLKRAKPSIIYCSNGLLIYPGTKVYRDALKEGTISESFWYGKTPLKVYKFSQEQIKKWRKRLLTYNTIGKLRYLWGQ